MDLPRLRPAVLLLHDGPGLANAASLLEPLAWRLCREGCTCFLYDQLTRGMPNRTSMRANVGDAQDVARFMYERLGEFEMHAVGHGYGGVVIMEALLRAGIWEDTARGFLSALEGGQTPRLRSVSLLGTPSSTGVLRSEALRLFRAALKDSQRDEGAAEREFWERHFSSGSSLVAEAYMRAAWKPWEDFPLRGWEISRHEMESRYAAASSGAPLLCVRGESDFVTDACVDGWRGVDCPRFRGLFTEHVVVGCGHNAQLQQPDLFAGVLHEWLCAVEAVAVE